MSVTYHCSHLADPAPPYPSSYASSSTSFYPLSQLYFCEECDSVRCDLCSVTEIASYFCPNCTFDVPSANVRGDKNRYKRQERQMKLGRLYRAGRPSCSFALVVDGAVGKLDWSSTRVRAWLLQKLQSTKDPTQPEFDAIKDHLDSYITTPAPTPTPARSAAKPTRHISHLTQMAAKALHRDVPGMAAAGATAKSGLRREMKPGGDRFGWDELGEYGAKESWKSRGLEKGNGDIERMRRLGILDGQQGGAGSWYSESKAVPERIPLQTKLTKRCPHPACRHLLVQPDTKSTRFKIKMLASTYLPVVELGRRRRRTDGGRASGTAEEAESRRRERRKARGRGEEVDEVMETPLRAGEVYTFHIAFSNPMYEPIQVRLTQPNSPHPPLSTPTHLIHIPTAHFIVNPVKDAWAYDDEEDYPDMDAMEMGTSEDGSSVLPSSRRTISAGKRSRLSVLATSSGGLREKEKRKKESAVEKKGNCSKVGLEVEILPEARGEVVFDLEIRFTYRSDESAVEKPKEKDGESERRKAKEEYKHFTFWTRVDLGTIAGS